MFIDRFRYQRPSDRSEPHQDAREGVRSRCRPSARRSTSTSVCAKSGGWCSSSSSRQVLRRAEHLKSLDLQSSAVIASRWWAQRSQVDLMRMLSGESRPIPASGRSSQCLSRYFAQTRRRGWTRRRRSTRRCLGIADEMVPMIRNILAASCFPETTLQHVRCCRRERTRLAVARMLLRRPTRCCRRDETTRLDSKRCCSALVDYGGTLIFVSTIAISSSGSPPRSLKSQRDRDRLPGTYKEFLYHKAH